MTTQTLIEKPCPQCSTPMPVSREYVTWCDQCNWNLNPREKERVYSFLDRIYLRLGKRFGRGLLEEMKQAPAVKPRWSTSTYLAFVVATLVHLSTLAIAAGGVYLIVQFWGNWLAIGGGIIMLLVAWFIRPRFGRVPRSVLRREEAPTLFELVDQIGAAVHAKPVNVITIYSHYNAQFMKAGLPPKTVLRLGLPLLLTLKGQEKVALITHELAHGVNGDPFRSGWIFSALSTLYQWVYLLRPKPGMNIHRGGDIGFLVDIANLIANVLGGIIAAVAGWVASGLALLAFRTSQRAEYYADYLAAETASTNGVLGLMDKFFVTDGFMRFVQNAAVNSNQKRDIFAEFPAYIQALPSRERERLRRANLLEGATLDSTHPPTAFRMEFLESKQIHMPKVTLSPEREVQIERELAPFRAEVQQALIERYKRSLEY